mmetsp:Transcript_9131/g.12688  ORF Transcript_9131/g.12688 Transcript_9131/m.12688 type:complete len:228 (-) Transcript_9131:346-1029(-)|eukprot:CAMPEP_0185730098 /NCGR_PEP_ID=MMETSP1171-20130828/8490_1 /TAXON_ID=374046 /ORGANISM="Helicotheca tamensis, Strain CCMP826" /LENGTH=227 /DNA_ID=CAMNT_0028399085 /DNA_START=70 /DNA_END=753 /DNA_ORIENTATION=-
MSAAAVDKNFRSTERNSNSRANIFLVECVVVLTGYVYALNYRLGPFGESNRMLLLATFGLIYMLRLNLMTRVLLKRELSIEELTFVILIWLPSIMGSFALMATTDVDLTTIDCIITTAMYLFGSYLNTYSELQRKIWKGDVKNKGRCYTKGLFSLSRNINYFGDSVLFGAWAAATGCWWNLWVPIIMSLAFWFHHIPDKEQYLQRRYGRDWDDYIRETPYAFVPYLC